MSESSVSIPKDTLIWILTAVEGTDEYVVGAFVNPEDASREQVRLTDLEDMGRRFYVQRTLLVGSSTP